MSDATRNHSSTADDTSRQVGRFAYDGLDRVLHERARLGILTSLATHPGGLPFNDLKELCALTDGNLSRHLQLLEQSGLVEIEKGYDRNRPLTTCRLTRQGRARFLEYIAVLEQVVADAAAADGGMAAARSRTSAGFSPA
ncbi:MAG: transcriptional regulator [Pirellulales bacterium]|nr:transcriptional regulator [Pirellulales bacterium]